MLNRSSRIREKDDSLFIQELVNSSKNLTRSLRKGFYASSIFRSNPFSSPPEIVFDEPLGPWSEFIIHSTSCVRSLKGTCTPCFYSRIPRMKCSKENAYKSLLSQTQEILKNFDDWVIGRQTRECNFPDFDDSINTKRILMGIGTSGSFFSNYEVPSVYRRELLRSIVALAKEKEISIQLLIETHVKDVIYLKRKGEIDVLKNILGKTSIVNFMGFESVNFFTREVIYAKGITEQDFRKAVVINKEQNFWPGAYIYTGHHSMTQSEIRRDVEKTLMFLRDLEVVPVIMFPHLQPYTIPHVLSHYKKYRLPSIFTMLLITLDLMDIFKRYWQKETDPWFISMEGGPPEPIQETISFDENEICKNCYSIFITNLRRLRRTYDYDMYRKSIEPIFQCKCWDKYQQSIINEDRNVGLIPIKNRVKDNLLFANAHLSEYLQRISTYKPSRHDV